MTASIFSYYLVTVLNYGDTDTTPTIKIDKSYYIKAVLYGNMEKIRSCDGVVFRLSQTEK